MPRIQVYTDPETKRRIQLAAAKQDVPVTEYCLEAIRQRLEDEYFLESKGFDIPLKPQWDENLLDEIDALREKILEDRGGELIDVDKIMEEMREERDAELLGGLR